MITVLPVTTEDGFRRCQDILIEVWDLENGGLRNIIPTRSFKLSHQYGGLVLAAHDSKGEIVGFAWAFPALDADNNLFLFSDTLAVLPQHRDKGIGSRLKFRQREWALRHKISMIRWTYDPLEARNGYLNIVRLGGLAGKYERNAYGVGLTGPNRGLETDRLIVDWNLNSPRVQECACTNRNATEPPDLPLCLELHSWNGESIPFEVRLNHREPEVLMPLPLNFQRLKEKHVDLAREWRSATRCVYEAYFARGYAIVGYHIKRHEGERYGYYRIARDWRESLDTF
jgi:predicted GNAT superfamily acetyltransferase